MKNRGSRNTNLRKVGRKIIFWKWGVDRQMERQRVTRAGVEQGPSTLAGVSGPEVGQGASGPAHTAPYSGCGISLGQSAAVV